MVLILINFHADLPTSPPFHLATHLGQSALELKAFFAVLSLSELQPLRHRDLCYPAVQRMTNIRFMKYWKIQSTNYKTNMKKPRNIKL
jgi:hypothetical protein